MWVKTVVCPGMMVNKWSSHLVSLISAPLIRYCNLVSVGVFSSTRPGQHSIHLQHTSISCSWDPFAAGIARNTHPLYHRIRRRKGPRNSWGCLLVSQSTGVGAMKGTSLRCISINIRTYGSLVCVPGNQYLMGSVKFNLHQVTLFYG